jgi:hypothetical protein
VDDFPSFKLKIGRLSKVYRIFGLFRKRKNNGIYWEKVALNMRWETAIMMKKCLQETTSRRVFGRLDFYRFEVTETLFSSFNLAGSAVFFCLGQSTMEFGVESL